MKSFKILIKNHCDSIYKTILKKNSDYSGKSDPFYNFTRVERNDIVSTEKGMLVRLSDKMARLETFINTGTFKVKSESFEDTCRDMAAYCLLLATYVELKNKKRK